MGMGSLLAPNGESYVFTGFFFCGGWGGVGWGWGWYCLCLSVYMSVSNITDVDGTLLDVEATACHLHGVNLDAVTAERTHSRWLTFLPVIEWWCCTSLVPHLIGPPSH